MGAGKFGKRHISTLARLQNDDRCRLVAAVDVEKQQLQKLSDFGCRLETSLTDVLQDVDAVDIVTPASTHYSLAKECILAGKHVLVEKPMAVSFEEAAEIHDLGIERRKTIGVGHLFRYHKLTQRLRELIATQKIGPIRLIEAQFLNPGQPRFDVGSILNYSHFVDLCNYLLDSFPSQVSCSVSRSNGDKFEDDAVAILDYPMGTQAKLHVGWAGRRKRRYFAVEGDLATVTVDYLSQSMEFLQGDSTSGVDSKTLVVDQSPTAEPLYLELDDFLSCINNGKTPLADSTSGVLSVYLCNRALQSAREHRTLDCNIQDANFNGKLLLNTDSIAAR